jgi:thermostable 8-oxoguanine DNA glycosylase
MVFNKNANQTADKLEELLNWCHNIDIDHFKTMNHFEAIRNKLKRHSAVEIVTKFRFGNTTVKAAGLEQLVNSEFNLRTCSVDELETISGFGMKTARYFILHTRKNARVACLDTHVLKWMKRFPYMFGEIKKGQPSRKRYLELEKDFLEICDNSKVTPAKLDLYIWNSERKDKKAG